MDVRKVELMLNMFYIKDAPHPRNSPYTFEPNGFYKKLKRRIQPIMEEHGTCPTVAIRVMQDLMVASAVVVSVLALVYNSYWLILTAGLLLGGSTVGAHNFIHIRDNWRKYYFDLSLFSHYEWRIGHVFSHHGFPNTAWDAEILWLTPWIEFLANRKKSWIQRFGSRLYIHFVIAFSSFGSLFLRLISVVTREQNVRPENCLPFIQLVLFAVSTQYVWTGVLFWILLHISCSYYVAGISLLSPHHHPICFHDGDEPRATPDYGLCILDATCVKVEDSNYSLFRILTTFGDHNLHHLFPAVCVSKIGLIKPIVEDTLKEFEEQLICLTQWQIFRGMYDQMARCEPHSFQYNLEQREKTQGAKVSTHRLSIISSEVGVADGLTEV
ncbi:unnamed protein product [Allacma fusca]|uniref:Fatty acid desaturase domain-containing protein n=1 Tax=Allacma fusca TaxID=39272 RepID=A0A8J2K6U3_9HEXA|nr:unnamed protein product [Allacma fusca]